MLLPELVDVGGFEVIVEKGHRAEVERRRRRERRHVAIMMSVGQGARSVGGREDVVSGRVPGAACPVREGDRRWYRRARTSRCARNCCKQEEAFFGGHVGGEEDAGVRVNIY